jgi:hypothetical protein
MQKIMHLLIAGIGVTGAIIFVVWMMMRSDKEAINAESKQFDADFAISQQRFAKTPKEKKYWEAKQKKLEVQITEAEKRQKEAEQVEKEGFDSLHKELAQHADSLEKELKAKEMEQLNKQVGGK